MFCIVYCIYHRFTTHYTLHTERVCKKAIGILYVCASICILVSITSHWWKWKFQYMAANACGVQNILPNFTHLWILPFFCSSFYLHYLSLSCQWLEFVVAMMLLFGCKSHDSNSYAFHRNNNISNVYIVFVVVS